ncbi:MAG: peptidylprolyl isomerase [Methylophilales bacterium]|nr:peptidylprolyl isomerase [Methylophilales bacterium]
MYSFSKLLGALLLAVAMSAHAADPATVNGKPVKQSLLDFMVKEISASGQKVDDDMRAALVNRLIGNEVVYQEAQKSGIDKSADFQAKQELTSRELLVNTFLQDYIKKNPVDDAAVKAEYDKFKSQWGSKEYKASHILVKTEQEAKDVIAQLDKKGDFSKIAKEKSLDSSKDKGGDLGWFPPARMVKPFADAVVKLQKGAYTSTAVQTQFGWHVIKLEDTRDAQPPAFETVKDELRANMQKQKIVTLVNDLRAKAKIVDNSTAKAKK